jgi:hypothetical protein
MCDLKAGVEEARVQKQKKPSAAQRLGLVSRRVNGKLYPTPEQAVALTEQAIAVRQVQNAVIWRIRKLGDEKCQLPPPEGGGL